MPTRSTPPPTRRWSLQSKARDTMIAGLRLSGALARARQSIAGRGEIVVLTLHRIVPDAQLATCRSPRGMVLQESLFAQLIQYLGQSADVITPTELGKQSHSGNRRRSRPAVLLTFDDGWLDNSVVALPYLAEARMRACFFVTTALAGQARPFWPERALGLIAHARRYGNLALVERSLDPLQAHAPTHLPPLQNPQSEDALLRWLKQFSAGELFQWTEDLLRKLCDQTGRRLADPLHDPMERLMTWNTLRALVSAGHSVGSHTCSHAILPQLQQAALARELEESRRDIEHELPFQAGKPLWVSYPNGSSSEPVRRAASAAGYRHGFCNAPGLWKAESDPLLLPRVNVWNGTLLDSTGAFSPSRLEYSLFWRPSHAHPRP